MHLLNLPSWAMAMHVVHSSWSCVHPMQQMPFQLMSMPRAGRWPMFETSAAVAETQLG